VRSVGVIRGSARRPGWCPQAGVVSLDSNQRVAFLKKVLIAIKCHIAKKKTE
jgi:hypothetical protein